MRKIIEHGLHCNDFETILARKLGVDTAENQLWNVRGKDHDFNVTACENYSAALIVVGAESVEVHMIKDETSASQKKLHEKIAPGAALNYGNRKCLVAISVICSARSIAYTGTNFIRHQIIRNGKAIEHLTSTSNAFFLSASKHIKINICNYETGKVRILQHFRILRTDSDNTSP